MQTYELNKSMVHRVLGRGVTAVYLLGDRRGKEFVPGYVGRSDSNVKSRLLAHAAERAFTRFGIVPTPTIFEAFRLECREWHRLPNLANRIHPDAPRRLPYICPYCIAAKEIAAGLQRN